MRVLKEHTIFLNTHTIIRKQELNRIRWSSEGAKLRRKNWMLNGFFLFQFVIPMGMSVKNGPFFFSWNHHKEHINVFEFFFSSLTFFVYSADLLAEKNLKHFFPLFRSDANASYKNDFGMEVITKACSKLFYLLFNNNISNVNSEIIDGITKNFLIFGASLTYLSI